jgi:hypothetical protein
MAQLVSFYLQQARNCGEAADAATLANQRGKFLDAQAAWQARGSAQRRLAHRARSLNRVLLVPSPFQRDLSARLATAPDD